MSLGAFFETMGPFLRGELDVDEVGRRLGLVSGPDLRFYAELVAFDQQRILAELVPAARRWIAHAGVDWDALVRAYVAEHPPAGWSVPHLGERFADWLAARRATDARLPPGIEAVTDLAWTRFLVRTAPDGPAFEVRHYPVDAVALTRTLLAGQQPDPGGPVTVVVYRHVEHGRVHTLPASLGTIAALVMNGGGALVGPLAALGAEAVAQARQDLIARGVLA